jgi:hypothetical protein
MSEATTPQATNPPTGGTSDSNAGNDSKPYHQRRGRRNRQRTNNTRVRKEGSTITHTPREKFMGRSDDLQGYTYDIEISKGGVAYTRTTEELARHVGEKNTTIGTYVRTAILTLNIPAPKRPVAPTGTDEVEKEIFKEKIRMYVKTEAAIETAMKSLYDLIWGQCTESLRSRLRGDDNFIDYSTNADSLALLKAIRSEMTGFQNKQYLAHALHKVMRDFYGLSQGKHMSNQEYYDEFNSLVATGEECGATIGAHPVAINDILANMAADPRNPTTNERTRAIKLATD